MPDLISVIIPVYKIEEVYLRKSIESILFQNYHSIEILIVDDGSPDNCGRICDEFAEVDSRIRVFHTKNSGVSAARNYAMDQASGEYIFFMDGDDYIEKETLEKLLIILRDSGSDCVMCSANHVKDDNMQSTFKRVNILDSITYQRDDAVNALCYMKEPYEGCDLGTIWGCLYKRETIQDIRFNEKIRIGEDFIFKYEVFSRTDSITCIPDKFYNYVIRDESAMRNGFDVRKIDSVQQLKEFTEAQSIPEQYRGAVLSRVCNILIVILFMIPIDSEHKKYRRSIISYLKKHRLEVITNQCARKKVRAALLLSYAGFDTIQRLYSLV